MHAILLSIAVLSVACALVACGQKGALYLPESQAHGNAAEQEEQASASPWQKDQQGK